MTTLETFFISVTDLLSDLWAKVNFFPLLPYGVAISHYLVSDIEAVHLGPCYGYVGNDFDPCLKVTEVKLSNKLLNLFGGMFRSYGI